VHDPRLWIAAAVGLAAGAWLAWISIQSLRQASLLRRAISAGTSGLASNASVAIHGTVVVRRPARGRRGCLWYSMSEQERGGLLGSRTWRTVGGSEDVADFAVLHKGIEVHVDERPTEVQGTESSTTHDHAFFGPSSRTTERWLPIPRELTVLGRLRGTAEEPHLVRDPALGLLFSPHPPEAASRTEAIKGIAGLIGVGAILVGLLYLLAR
jgi:hypothetical protein